jgi:regulator of protease activity HflC (stomatin/prohibitin superfamily)
LALGLIISSFFVKVQTENPNWSSYSKNDEPRTITVGWPNLVMRAAAGLFIVLAAIILITSSYYSQTVGEAKALKNFDGTIERVDVTPGAEWKSPLQEIEDWDVLNQQALYKGAEGKPTAEGEVVRGPQIQFGTSSGSNGDADIAVRYSIPGDIIEGIIDNYKTQDNLEARLIDQDIRSVVRNVPASYTPEQVKNKREEIERKIAEQLTERWQKVGIRVESIALQGTRFSAEVEAGFDRVQAAQANIATEQANLESAKVTAQQKVVSAQAEADANRIIESSLSDKVLQLRSLDTLKAIGDKGNLIITDGKTVPMITTPAK